MIEWFGIIQLNRMTILNNFEMCYLNLIIVFIFCVGLCAAVEMFCHYKTFLLFDWLIRWMFCCGYHVSHSRIDLSTNKTTQNYDGLKLV